MSLRRVLLVMLAAHAVLLAASLRHNFVWGEGRQVLGIDLWVVLGIAEGAALITFALLAGIPYARSARQAAGYPKSAIVVGGIVLALAAALVPPFLSTDIYDNLARGRVEAVHGANPYTMPPAQFPEDPYTQKADWTGYGNPYGPVSQVIQAAVVAVAGDRVWVGVYLFKFTLAACHVLTAWLLYLACATRSRERARQLLFLYLWNPWILLETAGSAHNDALMALGLAAMAWALATRRMMAATVAFGLAVLTKHSCAVLGPLLLVLAWRRRELAGFAAGVGVTAAVTALFAWRYFTEPGALEALTAQADHQRASLQHVLALLLDAPPATLTAIGFAVTVALMLWCLPVVRDLDSFGARGAWLTVAFILVGIPMFSPWYHLWWLPLAGLWAWTSWPRAFSWLAVLGPLSYLVFATTRSYDLDHQLWLWAVGLLPIAALVLPARNRTNG